MKTTLGTGLFPHYELAGKHPDVVQVNGVEIDPGCEFFCLDLYSAFEYWHIVVANRAAQDVMDHHLCLQLLIVDPVVYEGLIYDGVRINVMNGDVFRLENQ